MYRVLIYYFFKSEQYIIYYSYFFYHSLQHSRIQYNLHSTSEYKSPQRYRLLQHLQLNQTATIKSPSIPRSNFLNMSVLLFIVSYLLVLSCYRIQFGKSNSLIFCLFIFDHHFIMIFIYTYTYLFISNTNAPSFIHLFYVYCTLKYMYV